MEGFICGKAIKTESIDKSKFEKGEEILTKETFATLLKKYISTGNNKVCEIASGCGGGTVSDFSNGLKDKLAINPDTPIIFLYDRSGSAEQSTPIIESTKNQILDNLSSQGYNLREIYEFEYGELDETDKPYIDPVLYEYIGKSSVKPTWTKEERSCVVGEVVETGGVNAETGIPLTTICPSSGKYMHDVVTIEPIIPDTNITSTYISSASYHTDERFLSMMYYVIKKQLPDLKDYLFVNFINETYPSYYRTEDIGIENIGESNPYYGVLTREYNIDYDALKKVIEENNKTVKLLSYNIPTNITEKNNKETCKEMYLQFGMWSPEFTDSDLNKIDKNNLCDVSNKREIASIPTKYLKDIKNFEMSINNTFQEKDLTSQNFADSIKDLIVVKK